MRIDTDFTTDVLQRLVRINSINPLLDPDGAGEREIASYLSDVMSGLGLHTELFEAEPGRVSVVGRLPGSGGGAEGSADGGRSLMLNAHIDTVGVEGMADPFGGALRDGRVYGRGAYDMKGSMAACVAAAKALVDAGVTLRGDLVLAGVADEEYSSIGTADVIRRLTVDGAIVTEPTHLRTCLAHKGFAWLKIVTHGRAAHGSRFEEGVDANMRMGRVLRGLEALEKRLRAGRRHALVGPASLHAAILRGGTGLSTYAESCELQVERRTIPGESAAQVEREVMELLDELRAEDPTFAASFEMLFVRDAFEVAADAAIVKAVDTATVKVLGRAADHVGDTAWMDAALLHAAGVDTVVFGPSGTGAHAAEEWVDVESVVQVAHVLAQGAMVYCGVAS